MSRITKKYMVENFAQVQAERTQPDVRVYQDGSIVTLQPTNKWARLWIEDNCAAESWQWLGDALAIDYRFAEDVVAAMVEDGFEVSHV